MVKRAWHPAEGAELSVLVEKDAPDSSSPIFHLGDFVSREWPARLLMGILSLELGKSMRCTCGVQAPAVRIRRVHGRVRELSDLEVEDESEDGDMMRFMLIDPGKPAELTVSEMGV